MAGNWVCLRGQYGKLLLCADFGRIRQWCVGVWVCGWSGKAWCGLGKEQRDSVVDDAGVHRRRGAEVQRRRGAEAAAGQSIAKEGLAWVLAVGARGGVVGLL